MDHALSELLTARAVRERCTYIAELALDNKTRWFRIRQEQLEPCAKLVADTCRSNYPDLNIPCHSRWRHFHVNGINLWDHYSRGKYHPVDSAARTRTAIDLVFVSVLLDAGAGCRWRYVEPVTGIVLQRSEGLAAASVDLFFNRLAKFDESRGWYVDAHALQSLTSNDLMRSFQVADENPLLGIEGRRELLRQLGAVLSASGKHARPGDLFDLLLARSTNGSVRADRILGEILQQFGSIWPNGLVYQGCNLGDCGYHQLLQTGGCSNNIVPFHKLSQWLSYSLIEPLQWAGIEVMDLDALTGLPEYRNGGLLIDTGVIVPLRSDLLGERLAVTSEAVVEWRALTVFLLDRIAEMVRKQLGKDEQQLPLSSVLEGGTWAAGRRLARQLRCDGSPPINIALEGTIF